MKLGGKKGREKFSATEVENLFPSLMEVSQVKFLFFVNRRPRDRFGDDWPENRLSRQKTSIARLISALN